MHVKRGVGEIIHKWPNLNGYLVKPVDGRALSHDCVDFWRETVVVVPDGEMCTATTPGVKQSRASQWRVRASRRLGASVDMIHHDYALTCNLHITKTLSDMFLVIDDST